MAVKLEQISQTKLKNSQEDLWRIFRIMAEFVDGFELMGNILPSICVFGSARTKPEHKYYKLAVETTRSIVNKGFGIITGGGPGIMEAANKGASDAEGSSCGINIILPHEQGANKYIDRDKLINFRYFFVRKTMMFKYAQGYILLPGGFGTIDEFFEVLTLIQTGKTAKFPVVLMGKEHWEGLIDWVKKKMLAEGYISQDDMNLFSVTDDPEEAANIMYEFHKGKEFTTNF
ncbi:MAG: TIGR00730 family Rossman fold protein [Melioribacteraceae bacterium]|nr:TIGR00730 family Rossman fold protein [Melioribacteraceae bacterium]MCF8354285.1 TIGR00730 family Rossman fold protein [Melioribacteraceae bacterium]MCF8394583.1 TIGR00730 family Rossman fold protein [Melioribacteraceae bacterium]MCF8419748.1 TIGR00730 family Rossman fold protein [Melioribacteraceae bacterium]